MRSNLVKLVSSALALCISIFLIGGNVKADVFIPKEDFIAAITKVTNHGTLVFEEYGEYRLWGIAVKADDLREVLFSTERQGIKLSGGMILACYQAGSSKIKFHDRQIETKTAVCTYATHVTQKSSEMLKLSKHLLSSGKAIEICSETKGYFGTCQS